MGTWSKLIGPEYAILLLPIRRLLLIGIVIVFSGIPVAVVVNLSIPNLSFSMHEIVGIFMSLLVATPVVVSGIRLIRLELRIQRDLRAAGHTVKPGGPDLRAPGYFSSWSKRSGITPEVIIETGRKALAGGQST
jgi:hypothetical protein